MDGGITKAELKARHARLSQNRRQNQAQLEQCQERELGFRYVLGELEQMIAEIEERERSTAAAAEDFNQLAEVQE